MDSNTSRQGPGGQLRLALVVLLVATGLIGCATWPRDWTISDAQMSAQLARQFPTSPPWLEALDLRWSAPTVRAIPASNRIRAEIELDLGTRRGARGATRDAAPTARISLEARVQFEPADHTLRLREVEVLALPDAGPGRSTGREQRWALGLLAPWFDDLVVYRLSADQVERLQGQGLTVRDVVAVDGGLKFTVGPPR